VRLYRAVRPVELADIHQSGTYRPGRGNIGKYFFPTLEQARDLAGRLARLDDEPYTITSGLFRRDQLPEPQYIASEGEAYFVDDTVFPVTPVREHEVIWP
jgi:hypothetical protein